MTYIDTLAFIQLYLCLALITYHIQGVSKIQQHKDDRENKVKQIFNVPEILFTLISRETVQCLNKMRLLRILLNISTEKEFHVYRCFGLLSHRLNIKVILCVHSIVIFCNNIIFSLTYILYIINSKINKYGSMVIPQRLIDSQSELPIPVYHIGFVF